MTAINKKPQVRCSKRIAYALESLSKNTIADILIDRVLAEIGEYRTDEVVLEVLQRWLEPIAAMRNQKPVDLAAKAKRFDGFNAKYRQEHPEILSK